MPGMNNTYNRKCITLNTNSLDLKNIFYGKTAVGRNTPSGEKRTALFEFLAERFSVDLKNF